MRAGCVTKCRQAFASRRLVNPLPHDGQAPVGNNGPVVKGPRLRRASKSRTPQSVMS
jgi:hypothetical protein